LSYRLHNWFEVEMRNFTYIAERGSDLPQERWLPQVDIKPPNQPARTL